MVYTITVVIAVIVLVSFVAVIKGTRHRNRKLDEWGMSIPVSDAQQKAMWQLWEAAQAKQPPKEDPLDRLSKDDIEYTLKICSADFRPKEFGDANALRYASFNSLLDNGFNPEQAAIVVGMILNCVGRKDLIKK